LARKDEILAAVIAKFREEGFSTDLTISQIAKIVDIGKSTIYEYFKTKDDVFKEALLKISNDSIDEIINVGEIDDMGFEEAFKTQLSKILEVSKKSRMVYQIFSKDFMHRMPMSIRDDLKKKMEDTRMIIGKRFALIFQKGIQEKLVLDNQNSNTNIIFSSLIVGAVFRYSNSKLDISIEELVNELYKAIIKIGN